MNSLRDSIVEYFNGDELAADAFLTKYSYMREETPQDVWKRMAKEFAKIENKYISQENEMRSNKISRAHLNHLSDYGLEREDLDYEKIYNYFKDFKYIIPQGSIMASLGTPLLASLSNCMVIGYVEDSYGGIFQKDEEMAQLYKRRCGVGTDISKLRPAGAPTNNSSESSTGAVSFMERFSNTTREVAQNGRRGALMLTIDINHPDVMDFIKIKTDLSKVTGANISIRVRDEFMRAVKNDEDYFLKFPIDSSDDWEIKMDDGEEIPYNKLIKTDTGEAQYIKKIKAKEYWDAIVEAAWRSAEPGILFINNHWDMSPDTVYPRFKAITTNPCVVGDTLVLTNIGWMKFNNLYKRFKDGKAENITILTRDNEGNLSNSALKNVILTEENAEIYKIDFSNGEFLLVNDKHKFYDEEFNEIIGIESKDKLVISGNGMSKIIDVTKLNYTDNVFDLTCSPNFNFYGIYGREEMITEDDIIINDNVKFKAFEIIKTNNGFKFAKDLEMGDELI